MPEDIKLAFCEWFGAHGQQHCFDHAAGVPCVGSIIPIRSEPKSQSCSKISKSKVQRACALYSLGANLTHLESWSESTPLREVNSPGPCTPIVNHIV